ncbi:hypothetical protein FS749_004068 [Ceratobasidium sp. UAMH 11750]|nr:hypothetical protein FS749_004068 [Ceratobasidium sp. UAMH 11750]
MAAAALSLVWKVWSLTWRIKRNSAVVDEPLWITCILLGLPYVVWGIQAIVFGVVQAKSNVHVITFYCISDNSTLGLISGALAAMFLVMCLAFQIWTIVLVYLRFRKSNRLRRALGRHVSVPFFIRIIVFMVMVFVALVLCFIATFAFALEVPDVIISSIGPIMFFIFASQADVLICWHLMRPTSHVTDSRMTGSELSKPEPATTHPPAALGMSLEPSQSSSVWDFSKGSKYSPHIAICVDQIELTTRSGSTADHKPSPSFEEFASSHV